MSAKKIDLEGQLKDIRRQLNEQLGCLEFRMESKLSLLSEYQEYFRRRGEVEYEYARSLERLCERFERNTKQRNIRTEVRSTFNLWSTLLVETRKQSRERASLAEVLASEMVTRLENMAKDVNHLTKKCKEICIEVQENFLKELRDFSELTKVYQISCHNTVGAYTKWMKSKERLAAVRGSVARKKAEEKCIERQRQYKAQCHQLLKNRNDYILGITKCNAFSMQYFNMDILDVIENMDADYHNGFKRLAVAYKESEKEACEAIVESADVVVENSKNLNFETDLHYFLSEFSQPFSPPNRFQFYSFDGDNIKEFKVNTQDVYTRSKKAVASLREEIQTLLIQREEDNKTVQHMKSVNLKKYEITTVDDALAVLEANGDPLPSESSNAASKVASLDRALPFTSRGSQAVSLSQKGKKDTQLFTLGVIQRRMQRADRLALAQSQLDVHETALDEQKVPPVPVGVDSHGRTIPGEVPKLFGGKIVDYIQATGAEIPLIVRSCVAALERDGLNVEGIFRVPGPSPHIDELRKGFEEGRDPLAQSALKQKLDITAVASVLKAYFRELSIPLFPTDKYQEFISCTRQDSPQQKLQRICHTINTLPYEVVNVMRFLFRFLYRVSQYSDVNKMSAANLALVFGPTLTRAPDSLDPRQLHNDVPSVNMLIQHCINSHTTIFPGGPEEKGEEEEGEGEGKDQGDGGGAGKKREEGKAEEASPVPPPPTREEVHVHQQQDKQQLPEPSIVAAAAAAAQPPPHAQAAESISGSGGGVRLPPKPPVRSDVISSKAEEAAQGGGAGAGEQQLKPAPRPVEVEEQEPPLLPPPPPPREPVVPTVVEEKEKGGKEEENLPTTSSQPSLDDVSSSKPAHLEVEGGAPGTTRQEEFSSSLSQELSNLDDTLKDIESCLVGFPEETTTSEPHTKGQEGSGGGGVGVGVGGGQHVGSEEEVLESESDDDDEEEDVMKIDARALYDYAARSDKELSFKRGDTLQVIEKTPDSNWWDGFLQGRRGFIPVSYVEIVELQPMDVPAPPKRKSSMAFGDDEGEKEAIERACVSPITEEMVSGGTTAVGTTAVVPTAEQESSGSSSTTSPTDIKKEEDSGDLPTPSDLAAFQLPPLEDDAVKTEETKLESENQGRDSSSKPDVLATSAPSSSTVFSSGKVDFLSASSSGSSSLPPPAPLSIPRSNTGNVSKLLSQFKEKQEQQKVLVEPHNTHRRQHSADMALRKTESPTDINRSGSTSSSSTSAKPGVVTKPAPPPPIKPKPHLLLPSGDGLFPIVPHHSSSISPLQRAAMVGQTAGGPKKPPPPQQQQKQSRGSVKVKREKSQRKDEHHLAKAGAAMKSPPVDKTAADLHAELEAVAKARKRDL